MIAFRNLALRRGERLLLSNVDLSLPSGSRVGVVGRNGCGKSSLFAVVNGELEPDLGDIDLSAKVRIASVAQETPSLPDPAIDFVISGDAALWKVIQAEAAAMEAEDYEAVAEAHQKLAEMDGYDAPRAPASCCMAWASRRRRTTRRSRSSPAAGACASTSLAR